MKHFLCSEYGESTAKIWYDQIIGCSILGPRWNESSSWYEFVCDIKFSIISQSSALIITFLTWHESIDKILCYYYTPNVLHSDQTNNHYIYSEVLLATAPAPLISGSNFPASCISVTAAIRNICAFLLSINYEIKERNRSIKRWKRHYCHILQYVFPRWIH